MGCRDRCCGGAGVASWTYGELFSDTQIDLSAGTSLQLDIVNIFTMRTYEGVPLAARGCEGTCGGAQYLDIIAQGRSGVTAVNVELAQGPDPGLLGTPTAFTDWWQVQPGASSSECQTQRWRAPVVGPWVQLQIVNNGTGVMTMDLFAVFRNA